MPEAVVTGLGLVGPAGQGREALSEALACGRPAASERLARTRYHGPGSSRTAALVPQVDLTPWVPASSARRMGRPSHLAVAAAVMAIEEAGLDRKEAGGPDCAVVLATAFGAVAFTEKLLRQILLEGAESASPFLFTECVANAAAAEVAIFTGAGGPNETITQREAGPILALGRGAALIRAGRARRVLVGAVEEVTPLLHVILDRYGALCRPLSGAAAAPRPFDRARDGCLAGEGATVLILEAEEAALERGARLLARVRGAWSAFDPTAGPTGWGKRPDGIGRSLARRLRDGGVEPGDVDVVVTGASGSRPGDRYEALALRAAWEEEATGELPALLAPKGVTGEYGGGTLAPALLALEGTTFAPLQALTEPDPELGLRPHAGPVRAERALLTAFAAGGAAAWAALERA